MSHIAVKFIETDASMSKIPLLTTEKTHLYPLSLWTRSGQDFSKRPSYSLRNALPSLGYWGRSALEDHDI